MNKRQKKKLYKKLHGHNPPKVLEKPKPAQLVKPEPKPLELSGLKTAAEQFRQGFNGMAEGIRQMAQSIASAFSMFLEMVDNERTLTQELYEKVFVEEIPSCVTTAKILTAQRAAGKRRKRNYSKRRI